MKPPPPPGPPDVSDLQELIDQWAEFAAGLAAGYSFDLDNWLNDVDVRELILGLRDEGKTIFFTSHILADAEVICDQIAIILGGRIAEQGYVADLLGREIEGVDLLVDGIDEELHQALARDARRAGTKQARAATTRRMRETRATVGA